MVVLQVEIFDSILITATAMATVAVVSGLCVCYNTRHETRFDAVTFVRLSVGSLPKHHSHVRGQTHL